MLLKILVLVGLAIYFYNAGEPGLAFISLAAIIPYTGLFIAIFMTVTLVIKTWYGSAAIVASLIIYNVIGNYLLAKLTNNSISPSESPPD